MFYGDGVTIANPIGVFRNNSKVDLFYWSLVNLLPDHRTTLMNIQLACLCKNEDLKRYGPALVLSAEAAEEGGISTSFGASMERLRQV